MVRDDAEALRRRLYAPGASEADVDRYRVVEPAPVRTAPAPPPPEPDEAAIPLSTRRRLLLPLVALALVAAVSGGIAIARATGARPTAVLAATPIPMTTEDRQDIESTLAQGNSGGIAAFLVTHRATPALRTATRLYTLEHAGVGDGTFELTPVPAEAFQGRATVLLVLEQGGEARWTALRRQVDPSGEQQDVAQRTRGGEQAAGVLTTDTFRYASGDRPVELRVQAAPGARWGVAVVFSD